MSNERDETPKVSQKTLFSAWRDKCLPALMLTTMIIAVLPASAATGRLIPNNKPNLATQAKSLGPANSAEVIEVSIWLNPRNREVMDSLAEELYDPSSAHYRAWLTREDIATRFAPTAEQARTVEEFLSSHNLPVVAVGPNNFFVRGRGTVGDVEKAFHVQIGAFELSGKTYRANTSDPTIEGPAGLLAHSVSGLDNLEYHHPYVVRGIKNQKNPKGELKSVATSTVAPDFITPTCFTGVRTETYNTNGTFPIATYSGNGYTDSTEGCGYTPPEIWKAYNLNALYKAGFDGTGQTIVIIDWCGSPTITGDANAFSAKFGLPPLTSSNFHILNSSTPPTCGGPDPEINIDVEWAHAIAPGATIDLVVPPSATFQDVNQGVFYAVNSGLGNVISGSYGSEEYYTSTTEVEEENLINEIAAVLGISADFSSGDDGDFTFDYPQYNPPSVSAPADSPYATAVGGVSLALKPDNTIAWQAGWGTNFTLLDEGYIYDPPINFGFDFGSGGGPSAVFSKPTFQKKLPGKYRLLPDISWLADPYTGGVIAISAPFVYPPLEWTVYGGTSLACPMFSALWAIANQEAGVPLGQAAPYLYSLPAGTITDVLPVSSSTNVTAKIQESTSLTNTYTAAEIAAPLEGTTKFLSTLWDYPDYQDTVFVITFGTDSGLKTKVGWDDVTGLGTPNGKAFADYFNPGSLP